MRFKLLLSVLVLGLLGTGLVAGSGSGAGYALRSRTASAQTATAAQPELDSWSAKPRLGVRSATAVGLSIPASAPEAEKETLYVPAGYSLNLADGPGTSEGEVLLESATDAAFGDLTAVDPASFVNTPQAQACAPGHHAAVWIMDFQDGIFSFDQVIIPIYLDPTSGDETALGAYKLQACLPLAYVSSPGGSPLGEKMSDLVMEFSRLTNPATKGVYVWRTFVSNPDTNGNPDPTTTYELRSDMPLPAKLTLTGRLDRKHRRARLSGRLVTPAAPVDAVPVTLYRLRDGYWAPAGSTRTQSNGSYRFARRVTKTAYFGAEVWAIGDCTGDSTAPQGCVDETRAALDSPAVRIVVRRRRR